MAADAEREAAEREVAERDAAERATRRQFFRLFGRQTANSAGSVLAGVAALRATGRDALDELLAPAAVTPAAAGGTGTGAGRTIPVHRGEDAPPLPAADALRSPYRLEGDELLVLDQRELPGRVTNLRCSDASEVASAIRAGACGAGPVLAQLAAYTLVLAAQAAADRSAYAGTAAVHAAADTLRRARPVNCGIASAIERMLTASELAGGDVAALRAEADLIAMEAALDHARLGQLAAPVLASIAPRDDTPAGARLALLLHGDLGPLAGGMVGPGFAIIQSLATLGRSVHAWLTEGAPLMEGRRAAWQLEQLDVPNTTIPDAGVSWLLAHRPIDAVLLRVEWVAANGDAIAALGGRALASAAREAGVAVYAAAPLALVDESSADGAALPTDLRVPSTEPGGPRLDPAADMLPNGLLDGVLTDEGLLEPPYRESISHALAARAAR